MLNSTLQEETETEISMEVQSQEFDSNPHIFDREFKADEAKAEASIDETSQELHSNPQRIEGFVKQEECCESLVSNSEETEESSQENDLISQSLKVIPQIPSFTMNSILEVATKEMFELHLVRSLVDWKFLSKIDSWNFTLVLLPYDWDSIDSIEVGIADFGENAYKLFDETPSGGITMMGHEYWNFDLGDVGNSKFVGSKKTGSAIVVSQDHFNGILEVCVCFGVLAGQLRRCWWQVLSQFQSLYKCLYKCWCWWQVPLQVCLLVLLKE